MIIDGNLIAGVDIAQGDEEDMAIENLHICVGFTGVINVVRAVPALAAIKTPTVVNRTDAQLSTVGPAISFRIRNLLAAILSYFPTPFESHAGEAAFTFNA